MSWALRAPPGFFVTPLFFALLLFTACKTPVEPKNNSPRVMMGPFAIVTKDGLHLVHADGPGAIFVKPPQPHLYRNDKILLAPVAISYTKTSKRRRHVYELEMGRHIRQALTQKLESSAGWQLVKRPGKNVLRVKLAILEMELRDPEASGAASTNYLSKGGHITIVMDLRDSVTDEPLLRFVERGSLPGGFYADPSTAEVDRVKRAVDRFAADTGTSLELFHNSIQRIHEHETDA